MDCYCVCHSRFSSCPSCIHCEGKEFMEQEMVTITKEEYEALLDAKDKLCALEDAGVDNWSGYDYAIQLSRKE